MRRALLVLTLVAAIMVAGGGAVGAQPAPRPVAEVRPGLGLVPPGPGRAGPLSAAQRRTMAQGYLVPNQAAYERLKAEAEGKRGESPEQGSSPDRPALPGPALQGPLRRLPRALPRPRGRLGESDLGARARAGNASGRSTSPGVKAAQQRNTPTLVAGSIGLTDPNSAPSDSTSAVAPDRYIELVNRRFGIYGLGGSSPLAQGSLAELTGTGGNVFDPQVIWDPDTSRFYYTAAVVFSATDNRLAFGFSKTATPSSAADFCRYNLPRGSRFEDYPKLGDTRNRLLIGANAFDASDNFVGADLFSITKPPAGTSCPAASTLTVGSMLNLPGTHTPVPANQTDGSTTGHVTSLPLSFFTAGSANQLLLYDVAEVGNTFALTPKPLTVPTYEVPAGAQQPRTTARLDTLDGRNTQAVSAINPSRGQQVSLWTQHTIFGGGGAQVRWYEINPAVPAVLQSQDLGAPGIYFFNAAISPDRAVNGSTKLFGDTMLLGMNFSSTDYAPGLVLEQKVGSSPGTFAVYLLSPGPLADFTCADGTCRWGDYSGMTPYPATPSGAGHGLALHTTQYVRQTGGAGSGWGTINLLVYAAP